MPRLLDFESGRLALGVERRHGAVRPHPEFGGKDLVRHHRANFALLRAHQSLDRGEMNDSGLAEGRMARAEAFVLDVGG